MAKKSFKGGLDSLLSNADLPQKKPGNKKNNPTEETSKLSEKDKHWLQLKNEKLLKELHLWRT
ncbi:MAG: hypothetical protein U9N85_05180, partial [Bacteroidota bacterium]|nr:hypothetical protein [Bacteroidota bacterium]